MIALPIALGALLLHVATAWRYGYFRDELYFIACSKHLAWGYVDQPPLVAIAAWLAAPVDYNLVALRLLPALGASLAAFVAAAIANDIDGGRFAKFFAALCVALTPAYLLLGNVLTTTSFEGLSWTLVVLCVIRIVRGGGVRWWAALSASITFGLYGKYSMALLAAALVVALACTNERRILATRWFPLSIVAALVLFAPNIAWQWQHGWPFFDVLQGDAQHRHAFNNGLALEYRRFGPNAFAFLSEQALYTNPVAMPVWLAGLVAPFAWPRFRDLRFVSIAYALLLVAAVALEAKGYYIIGMYGPLLAMGAVVIERATRAVRVAAVAVVTLVAIATLPLSVPVLDVNEFIPYSSVLGMTGRGAASHLAQPVYAEEFGWERLAADVAKAYSGIDPATRGRTAIYADTYADAAAIDFYGPRYGLPQAIGSQNSYWLWGTHGYDGSQLIAIGASRIDVLKRYYRDVRLIETSDEPLKWVVEGPAPIYLCTGPRLPFAEIWNALQWYGA